MTTSTNKPSTAKYRPVLTQEQLSHIVAQLKQESPLSDIGIATIHYLTGFIYKIEYAGSIPAYVPANKPKINSLEALGGATVDTSGLSKEEAWAASYAVYTLEPSSCTVQQIQEAHEHMYLNDLMTTEQIERFETSTIKREAT